MPYKTDQQTSLPVSCKHWQDCNLINGGCCSINAYRQPSHGICLHVCNQYDGPDRGLGDTVKRAISKLTAGHIKPCSACKKRQRKLNQLIPYHGE
ncbi:MAG: hypothetical protein CMJ19_20495 [Phycisphaeraceae bacterium]|nr:hypothetical protein [Phycisphaeraceae bacterium]